MTQDGKHTPGPWQIDPNIRVPTKCGGPRIRQATSERAAIAIADLFDVEGTGSDTTANARLIAAAPDLLAALRAFVHAFDHKTGDPLALFASIERARASIARATGGEG